MTPNRRAVLTAALFASIPSVVAGVIAGVLLGWVAGPVVLIVLAGALWVWARYGGDLLVAARLGGQAADRRAHARLINLVEGLSIGAGVRQPRLVVVDSPGLNALAAGSSESRAVLAVTSALLAELDRIELEAVVAEELWLIRHQETVPGTVLAATFGLGRRLALVAGADARADLGAVSLTRYPPALASALEKMEAKGSHVAGQPGWMAHLWLADPRPRPEAGHGRTPLGERIEALREL